ncbi:hypothetical protein MRX96_045055 [Rhipicephalus microplus]
MSASAGQWQVVSSKSSKNKSSAGGGADGKMSKAQKKKLAENMPRIEPLGKSTSPTCDFHATAALARAPRDPLQGAALKFNRRSGRRVGE